MGAVDRDDLKASVAQLCHQPAEADVSEAVGRPTVEGHKGRTGWIRHLFTVPVWHAMAMTVYRIRIEGPAAIAVRVATELADAPGVELISSERPSIVDENTAKLDVSVEGTREDVEAAVSKIGDGLPDGASIDLT